MTRKVISITVALAMVVTAAFSLGMGPVAASADSTELYEVEKLEGEVDTEKNNYMTDAQYKKLFGVDIDSKQVDAFDPNNTDHPLNGYEPIVLSELFLGYMNRTDNYDGQFAVMENASNDSGFNMNTMWNTNYGGINTYYGENQVSNMYTHGINTIALTPGNLMDADADTRQQILIENRIYLKEDGAFYEDDTYQRLETYTLKEDGSSWVRTNSKIKYLSDAHWAWYIDVPEQQSYTEMAVGDYDGDNYNEVAVYVPASSVDSTAPCIEIYQPQLNDDGAYGLSLEHSFYLTDIGPRFGVKSDEHFAYGDLNTTKMAGRDDLVVSVTLPYYKKDGFNDNGALAVISFKNGSKTIEFNSDLKYDNNAYHFKMQSTVNADLNGDGTDELVVGGFKNTGYSTRGSEKGTISDSENLVNVLLFKDGKYQMAWSKPQATAAVDLDHDRAMDAPAAMAAGKYRAGAVADTVFLEGTYLDFAVGSGDTVNEQIKNGKFNQNTSENMTGLSGATINMGASGAFVSDKPGNEEVVFYTTHGSGDVDVDIRWGHPGNDGKIATDIVNDNYISDTEYDDGTIVNMCAINVDQDTSMIKYTGKTVGWSNPVVYGILLSMPYWQEMDYGDVWNDRGQTDFGITKSKEDGTTVTAGLDVGVTVNLSGEATVFGNGVGAGIDFGPVGSYAHENTESKELSKNITWSVGGGQDSAALMVMPVVVYEYEVYMPEHQATKEEQAAGKSGTIAALTAPIACTTTFEPVITDIPVDTYNDVIEEFNVMAEAAGKEQDKLPLIDMDEIYADAKTGDPSSYKSNPRDISSLKGTEGKDYYYIGEVHAQTGKDKSVETLAIETTNSQSESNGFTAGMKGSIMGKVTGGMDFMSIVSVTGSVGLTVDAQAVGGKTWISTESTGITYSGSFANLPAEAEGYGYEYSAGLVKWNADLEGFDQGLEVEGTDEVLPDKTIVIGPTVTMLSATAPPALPLDLHVLGTTDDSAVLEWTNPEGARAPHHYKVYYSKDDTTYYPLDGIVDGNKTRYVVKGLNEDAVYYFKLESYGKEASMRSIKSAPVAAMTKNGSEPVITKHPSDCYAEVGEKALFNIEAKPNTEGNNISYQWQQLAVEDYGISWNDINVASDSAIGRTAEFNAAYASPAGLIRAEDVDDLDGTVYRCTVAEHQAGKLDYTETTSKTATLYAEEENLPTESSLKISSGDDATDEIVAATGESVTVTGEFADADGEGISNADVYFALMDKNQDGKCIEYVSDKTDENGKTAVTFENLNEGQYEITAIVMKKADKYRAAVSNSITLTVNTKYEIIYELNGGVNHNLNPINYSAGTKFILLRKASKEGHDFTGWYLNPDLTDKVDHKWFDVSEMSGTIVLYAGWELIEEEVPVPDEDNAPGDTDEDKELVDKDPADNEEDISDADKDNTSANKDTDKIDSTSKTGDDSSIGTVIAVMLGALSAMICAFAVRRKKTI